MALKRINKVRLLLLFRRRQGRETVAQTVGGRGAPSGLGLAGRTTSTSVVRRRPALHRAAGKAMRAFELGGDHHSSLRCLLLPARPGARDALALSADRAPSPTSAFALPRKPYILQDYRADYRLSSAAAGTDRPRARPTFVVLGRADRRQHVQLAGDHHGSRASERTLCLDGRQEPIC
jgi:hypothetical protein